MLKFRERVIEKRLFEEGGGLGDWLDSFLALVGLNKADPPPRSWVEIEKTARSNPAFADRLSSLLIALKEKDREAFLKAAPSELRPFLIGLLTTQHRMLRSFLPKFYIGVWILGVSLGLYGVEVGLHAGRLSFVEWVLLLSGVGTIPAIILLVWQIRIALMQRKLLRIS